MIGLPSELRRSLESRGRDLTLFVIRLGAMGDILRTIPPVRLVRAGLPESKIFWVLEDKWRSLVDGHPDLEGVIAAPRRDWEPWVRSPRHWLRLRRGVREFRAAMRAFRPDLVLDFHGNLRSGLVSRWSGAPVRIGFSGHQQKEGNRWFNSHHVPSNERRTPRMERNLSLIRALGIADGPLPGCDLRMVERGTNEADELLTSLPSTAGGFAILSPGASTRQAYKRPPAELLAAASRRLRFRDVTPLVVYGPGEAAQARAVVDLAPDAAVCAPPTRLPTLAALLARARLFVGGDTGPLHMACAVGCPVVGVFGPTDPQVNRPWGVPYRVVSPPGRRYTGIKRLDREAGGFEGIDVAQIEHAVTEVLGEG